MLPTLMDRIHDFVDHEVWDTLEKLLIISPYISANFFTEIAKKFKPDQTILITDDSCSTRDAKDALEELPGEDNMMFFAWASGLVHLKLFYFHYRSQAGKSRRVLAWGSANASYNAFFRNVELLSISLLRMIEEKEVIRYLDDLWNQGLKGDTIKVSQIESLVRNTSLYLPALTATRRNRQDSFDAWLQAGFLCHKYDPATDFLKFNITLAAPLPQGNIDNIFRQTGLISEGERDKLTFSYLTPSDIAGEKVQWKSTFFIETCFGHWCSRACHKEFHELFAAANKEGRKEALDKFLEAEKTHTTNYFLDQFENTLLNAVQGLKADFDTYLPDDTADYRQKASDQMDRQIKKAKTNYFAQKYVYGYDLQPLPRFRNDQSSWETFALDFCESLLFKALQKGDHSLLAKIVFETFGENKLKEIDCEGLLKELRANWDKYNKPFSLYHQLYKGKGISMLLKSEVQNKIQNLPDKYGPWEIESYENGQGVLVSPSSPYYIYDEEKETERGYYFGIEDLGKDTITFYLYAENCDKNIEAVAKRLKRNGKTIKNLQGELPLESGYIFTRLEEREPEEEDDRPIVQRWADILILIINTLTPFLEPLEQE